MSRKQNPGAVWLQCVGTLDANRASSLVSNYNLRVANSALTKAKKGGDKVWRN